MRDLHIQTDQEIEDLLQEKGLTAWRVTNAHINMAIDAIEYYRIPDTSVTICVLKLKNGYNVIAHSAAISEENFDTEIGQKVALKKAMNECRSLFAFHYAAMNNNIDLNK